MIAITRQTLANSAAERWKRQYFRSRPAGQGWYPFKLANSDKSAEMIYEELVKLGPEPDPDAADVVVGSSITSVPKCDECGKYGKPVVICIGEPPDYESNTANICRQCLTDGANLATQAVHQ